MINYGAFLMALVCGVVPTQALALDVLDPVGDNQHCTQQVEQLLDLAYKNYPSIQASKQLILSAEEQKKSAKWNYFPTPSIDLSQRSGYQSRVLRLDQPLWTGGKLTAMNALADARYQEAEHTLGENGYALAEKLIGAVQTYVQADGEIKGFTDGKAQLQQFAEMLDRRIAAGVSAQADRELLNARIAQVESDLLTAQSRYEVARSQMEFLTGRPFTCAVAFDSDNILKQQPVGQLQNAMLKTHPSLKKLNAQIGVAEAEKKGKAAALLPNVSLRLEHQHASNTINNTGDDTQAYLSLGYSPGAGLSGWSDKKSSHFLVLQARENLRTREQELKDTLALEYADYQAASGRVPQTLALIDASQKVLESYTRLFIAGKRQWLELVNASREQTQNQIAFATLRASLIGSSYRLSLQSGQIINTKGKP